MDYALHHGDCLDVLRTLPAASVDACVTDPPYGIDLRPQRGITRSIAGDGRGEAEGLWREFVPLVEKACKQDTAHIFFAGWSEPWVKTVLEESFTVKGLIVWVKNIWGIGYYLRPQHEFAWYCHKGTPRRPIEPLSNVWEYPRESAPIHSCQKPLKLMKRAVSFCAPDGSVILDPFMGSGSTGVAAAELGFDFIGIERDADYLKIAEERIAAAHGQERLAI